MCWHAARRCYSHPQTACGGNATRSLRGSRRLVDAPISEAKSAAKPPSWPTRSRERGTSKRSRGNASASATSPIRPPLKGRRRRPPNRPTSSCSRRPSRTQRSMTSRSCARRTCARSAASSRSQWRTWSRGGRAAPRPTVVAMLQQHSSHQDRRPPPRPVRQTEPPRRVERSVVVQRTEQIQLNGLRGRAHDRLLDSGRRTAASLPAGRKRRTEWPTEKQKRPHRRGQPRPASPPALRASPNRHGAAPVCERSSDSVRRTSTTALRAADLAPVRPGGSGLRKLRPWRTLGQWRPPARATGGTRRES